MIVSYNWLQEYLGDDAPSATEVADLLGAHAFEIEGVEEKGDDVAIDVDVLPNRSSDCLCHRGIAREIASIIGQPLQNDPLAKHRSSDDLCLRETDLISVEIADSNACPRFTASLISGIEIKDSPEWLQERLTAIGQRPINNIVDATNYVMFAIGQPLHAYDADLFPQVDGKWQFGVRYASEGETVSLIAEGGKDKVNAEGRDGALGYEDRVVELQGTELLIIDESSNTPIGLAGVKGGRFAGVHQGTTKVIIEAANFNPGLTRKTARRLGIVIDASKRFENEPSRELPPYAQSEIIQLILAIAGGSYEGTIDEYLNPLPPRTPVSVTIEQANALLGLQLGLPEAVAILERLGMEVTTEGQTLLVTAPFERTDITIAEDVIEEIGRVHGYDHVVSVVPETVPLSEYNPRHYYSEQVRCCLLSHGFSEVITSSFRNKDKVQLRNALASDKTCLRSNLTNNVSEALDQNAGRTDLFGAADTRIFEIGTVFTPGGTLGVAEHVSLCLGVRFKASGYGGKEDKLLASILTELETILTIPVNWNSSKGIAEVNFTEVFTTLPAPTAYDPVAVAPEIAYQPFSVYQHMSRDIAMWITAGVTAAEVEGVLNEAAGDLRVRTTLVDEFTKDDRTSLAFRLVFQSNEKTLTDEEVTTVMDTVYKAVEEKGWETR